MLRLTASDLRGRHAISYMRFSSSPQERGSTIDRQAETLANVVSHYGLILDDTLTDRALSASKGHHRTRGKLADLLTAVKEGRVEPGTVLVFEAWDRLFREGILDVFPILAQMIRAGLILVSGRDLTIYDEQAINGDLSHKLVAEINAAREYTKRISEFATGAHKRRRAQVEKLAADPAAAIPTVNGRTPAWIERTKGQNDYRLHPERSATLRRIFEMCVSGSSARAIAITLNRENVPVFPGMDAWRATRLIALIRDRHAMGYYTPHRRDAAGRSRPIGPEVKIYPAAIEPAQWVAAQDALASRQCMVGRAGGTLPNLFPKKAFCSTCGSSLTVDSGGRAKGAKRKRHWVCSGYIQNTGCTDKRRFDLDYYESKLLIAIVAMMDVAPSRRTDTSPMVDRLGEIRDGISAKQTAVDQLLPRIAKSPALADTVERLSIEIDQMRAEANELQRQIEISPVLDTQGQRRLAIIRNLVSPALSGDMTARDRLRNLMAKSDLFITGETGGGLFVGYGLNGDAIADYRVIDPPGIQTEQDAASDAEYLLVL